MNEITMIPVEWLRHHPENPRLDLGDLTELTESIRANGILQNLTVVFADKDQLSKEDQKSPYSLMWVVIGNRRLEAAKAAGLKELPCSVREMSHEEQIATMLQENMQRSDLTVYEQAKGIQMMMDLGFDKDQISERTGFSRSTIDRRLAVATLPEDETREAVECGWDLTDLVEISKIEDRKVQTQLLTGTTKEGLRASIERARRDQERSRERKRLIPEVEKFATRLTEAQISKLYGSAWEHLSRYDVSLEEGAAVTVPEEKEKYFYRDAFGKIEIWRKAKRERPAKSEAEIAREKREHDAKELNARMKENRIAFVASWVPTKAQETSLKTNLLTYALDNTSSYDAGSFRVSYHSWDNSAFRKLCGMPKEEGRDAQETVLSEIRRRGIPLGRAMLAWILCGGIEDFDRSGYANEYNGSYKKDEDLDLVYDILMDCGYEMTEEEAQWKDGTHPFYQEYREA